jgi:heat shock protein HtpX
MAWFKRIAFFMLVNFGIMIMLMLIVNLLGLNRYMTPYGIDYQQLALFSLVWGSGGAFISLLLSKPLAKLTMGVKVIDPRTADLRGQEILATVHNLARAAGLSSMPEVGVYDSPEVNAFATGATKGSSLVAVSTGLLERLSKQEIEGVIGHEVAHIANGDMITMTLIQGIMNAFVIFLSKAIAWTIAQAMQGNDRDRRPSYWAVYGIEMALQMVFGLAAMLVVCWFSRMREFRADRGSAQIGGAGKMIAALEKLKRTTELVDMRHEQMASLKISGGRGRFGRIFSTHPPLEERIARLQSSY